MIDSEKTLKRRGWAVFDSDGSMDGAMQICAVDISTRFEGDYEALLHVIARAKRGNTACIDALWEVLDHDGLVNRILWQEACPSIQSVAYPEGFEEAWPQYAVGAEHHESH